MKKCGSKNFIFIIYFLTILIKVKNLVKNKNVHNQIPEQETCSSLDCKKEEKNKPKLYRKATHANKWYTGNPNQLKSELSSYFQQATKHENYNNLKSIIVPHAGYYYSGSTAAKAFININANNYNRILIIGPSHHEYFYGCGLSPFDVYKTPFGDINIDTQINKNLINNNKNNNLFHILPNYIDENEHSIEMELPFLKMLFNSAEKNFTIIPIIIGEIKNNDFSLIAHNLLEFYKDEKTLFVISSDFCHWGKNYGYTYIGNKKEEIWKNIENLDKEALNIISEMSFNELLKYFNKTKNTICGRNAILLLLNIIEKYKENQKEKKLLFETLGYKQSNKVKNADEFSVSYAAVTNFVF